LGLVRAGERDDRAAEATAGHPRRDRASFVGELDQIVELRRRRLPVMADALMSLPEHFSESL
jgi:hypothetical protein